MNQIPDQRVQEGMEVPISSSLEAVGPRPFRETELESLREITEQSLRPGLIEAYPLLFDPGNYENLRVYVVNGRCVSHVGMIERDAVLFGCQIKVACVGAVCTDPDFRGKGLASACLDDAIRKACDDGVDLMMVSGSRNLYRMRDCIPVGCDAVFQVVAGSIPVDMEELASSVEVENMTDAELPLVMECYRNEPVRFRRSPEDYRRVLQCGCAMGRPSDVLLLNENNVFKGYVVVPNDEPDENARLAEFAGDRQSILAAVPQLLRRYDLSTLRIHVMGYDRLLRSLFEHMGLESLPSATPGTVRILNFAQLMQRLRPRFEELLDTATVSRLRFWERESLCGFALGSEEYAASRELATRMLFGTPDGICRELREMPGSLGTALRGILPLPTLWYGMNFT